MWPLLPTNLTANEERGNRRLGNGEAAAEKWEMSEGRGLPAVASAQPELIEPVVIDAEVVREFMDYGLAYFRANFLVVRTEGLDRFLVDKNAVRENQVVALVSTLRERDACVQAEERMASADACLLAFLRRGAAFDNDGDVLNATEQVRRQ